MHEYKQNKAVLESDRVKLQDRLIELRETIIRADDEQPVQKRLQDIHELLTDESIDFEIKYQAAHFLISKIVYDKPAKTLRLTYKY